MYGDFLAKSANRKYNEIKNRKRENGKRDNPNRGKHGCYRLHAMKAHEEEQIRPVTHKEKISLPAQQNETLTKKLKVAIRKLWK